MKTLSLALSLFLSSTVLAASISDHLASIEKNRNEAVHVLRVNLKGASIDQLETHQEELEKLSDEHLKIIQSSARSLLGQVPTSEKTKAAYQKEGYNEEGFLFLNLCFHHSISLRREIEKDPINSAIAKLIEENDQKHLYRESIQQENDELRAMLRVDTKNVNQVLNVVFTIKVLKSVYARIPADEEARKGSYARGVKGEILRLEKMLKRAGLDPNKLARDKHYEEVSPIELQSK